MADMTREERLMSLRQDMKQVGGYLQKVAEQVLENEISKHPIFIAHKEEAIGMGRLILPAKTTRTEWSYSASLLEEFIRKDIVDRKKADDFREVFKDPKYFACFFLLHPEDMNFIFCPYDLDADIKGTL